MISIIKSDPLEDLLNESFVKKFIETNVLPKMNLSDEFGIVNCEIIPFRVRKKEGIAAIEFKLQLCNKENHQQISRSIVGKWRNDGRGKEIFDLLQEVWNKGFNRKEERDDDGKGDHLRLRLYEPIAYFPDYNLMIISKANGVSLKNIIITKMKEKDIIINDNKGLFETYFKEAANWLVKLHSISRPIHGRTFSMQGEEKKLSEWSQHLSWLYPDFAEKINNILTCILKTERSLNPKFFVLIHGEFHPSNIFIDGTDLTVIDFDNDSCKFDAARDLGYFIARLQSIKRKYNLLPLNVEAMEKRFLDEYTTKMSTTEEEALERIGTYKARTYLQHLHFRYWIGRKRHEPGLVDCEYWIKKAEQEIK